VYLRYDIAADAVDPGFPIRVGDSWPEFEAAGFDVRLDAAWLKITQAKGVA
jgi:hypothetical protein